MDSLRKRHAPAPSITSSAIRCCFVCTSPDSNAPAVFPINSSIIPARPFPPPAPHGSGSPSSSVLWPY